MSATTTTPKTCFDGLIGIRGTCDSPTSASGLFIDDAGISLTELNEFVTDNFKNGIDLFEKKLAFSINEVSNKVHAMMLPKYRAASILENSRVGIYQDNLRMIAPVAGKMRTMQFELTNTTSFLDLFVSEIALQVDKDGTVDVSVFDLIENRLIETIPIECKKNEISVVYPSKKFKSNRKKLNLLFAYDSTGIHANTSYLTRSGGACFDCAGGNRLQNQHMRISPGLIDILDDKIAKNIVNTNDTGGMSIVYSLSCNHTDWLCSISNAMALPILWNTAAAIMEHALLISPTEQMTPRTMKPELLKQRYDLYNMKFDETFNSMVKNISPPSDEKCFICNNRIRTASMIPS